MNQYSEILIYLKQIAEEDTMVNTVTKGSIEMLDLEKNNIYPIVHLTVGESGSFTNGQTIIFSVAIEVLQQRELSKDIVDDKFWRQDNEVDNHNETLAILNRLWLKLKRDLQDKNITASENPALEKITFEKANILDGWGLDFEIETPNTTISLC